MSDKPFDNYDYLEFLRAILTDDESDFQAVESAAKEFLTAENYRKHDGQSKLGMSFEEFKEMFEEFKIVMKEFDPLDDSWHF
jgi:hypothetical protein